ncbi:MULTISPECIES: hypothetical protein [Actinomycetes]|uniref:hypothetical protein n=1 Tax=Aeromicrobium tamlense TaxID=375541 RepID=UPI0031D92E55
MSSDVTYHKCPRCDESIFFDEENQICDKCEWGLDEGDDKLPFRCQWEVGVNEAGDPDDWDHYHPLAKSEDEAERKAQQEARDDGYTDPYPYMVTGPFKPKDPIRVGEEMIEEVFGDVQ